MTVIYLLISSLFLILFNPSSLYAEELTSFCFEPQVNLSQVQKSLEFLLLPRETLFPRPTDNCFEVSTSTDRAKLLEKFLRKSYTLVAEKDGERAILAGNLNNHNCQLELRTVRKKKIESTNASGGSITKISAESKDFSTVSTAQILLGFGKPGLLELEGRSLYVECSGGVRGIYQLIFSFSEESKSKISTHLTVRQGEPVQIAQITNELNNKSKTLGLSNLMYQETTGSENINYELQIK